MALGLDSVFSSDIILSCLYVVKPAGGGRGERL